MQRSVLFCFVFPPLPNQKNLSAKIDENSKMVEAEHFDPYPSSSV